MRLPVVKSTAIELAAYWHGIWAEMARRLRDAGNNALAREVAIDARRELAHCMAMREQTRKEAA